MAPRTSLILAFLYAMTTLSSCGYVNNYDEKFTFTCPEGRGISRVYSRHNNGAEDRRYGFECKSIQGNPNRCSWHGYLNSFDEAVVFVCPHGGIVRGLNSYHSNHYEDRRWKVYCCYSTTHTSKNCQFINWVNNWDQYFDYHVPSNKVMNGIASYHHNGAEDRRFKFSVCSFE